MNKIISLCLYGNLPYYIEGAKKNIQLAKLHFPDWKVRLYVSKDCTFESYLTDSNIEIIKCDDWNNHLKRLWRYLPLLDKDVDVFISRDCDSRLTKRDYVAVEEFIATDKLVHAILDHQNHLHAGYLLMGGMIGFKKNENCPNFHNDLMHYINTGDGNVMSDQIFLRQYILPKFSINDIYLHCDSISMFDIPHHPMLPLIDKTMFIGNRFNENDIPEYTRDYYNSLVSNSQSGQDLWVIDLFSGKRNGFFLEIGGGDGLMISNTLLLEKHFGWNGILVEPTSAFEQLVRNRPNCITDNSCIASQNKTVTVFEIFDRGQAMISKQASTNFLLSTVREDIDIHDGQKLNSHWGVFQQAYQKEAVTLEEVLRKYQAPRVIDYFSLDVEGYEFEILKNFPFKEYTFLCLGVENSHQELHKLLEANGYIPRVTLGDVMYTHISLNCKFDNLSLPQQPISTDSYILTAQSLFQQGNLPLAELYLRRSLASNSNNFGASGLLNDLRQAYGFSEFFELSEQASSASKIGERYLLIKAWGYGFWSDVHHVATQLLLAELTQRIPIILWGRNSLFRNDSDINAFGHFFQEISSAKIEDIPKTATIYPSKWHWNNLYEENVNKWEGECSRLAAQYLFDRSETLLVSDFYSTLNSIIPWIGRSSKYFGLTEDAIYSELFQKYLKPTSNISGKVDSFYVQHMQGRPWLGIHIRGSDKIYESPEIAKTNASYLGFIDRIVELNPTIGIFILTDSATVMEEFNIRYGERLLCTQATRVSSNVGVHYSGHDGTIIGEEVLVDALLALKCDYFVGNKESNVSLAISTMRNWPQGFVSLLGSRNIRGENLFLHMNHVR